MDILKRYKQFAHVCDPKKAYSHVCATIINTSATNIAHSQFKCVHRFAMAKLSTISPNETDREKRSKLTGWSVFQSVFSTFKQKKRRSLNQSAWLISRQQPIKLCLGKPCLVPEAEAMAAAGATTASTRTFFAGPGPRRLALSVGEKL